MSKSLIKNNQSYNCNQLYVTGNYKSTSYINIAPGIKLQPSTGAYGDSYILRYNSNGKYESAKKLSMFPNSITNNIIVDSCNNVYTTGYFFLNLNINVPLTVKYNSFGEIVWYKHINTFGYGNSITIDACNNVYITGSYKSKSIFVLQPGISFPPTNDNYNIFTIKYNSKGDILKVLTIKTDGFSDGYGITVDPCNNIYITGKYMSSSIIKISLDRNIVLPPTNNTSIPFIVKYDLHGNAIWANYISTSGTGSDIALDSTASNIYVIGKYNSTSITNITSNMNINLPSTNGKNIPFIIKYNSNGNAILSKAFKNYNYSTHYSIILDSCNNIYASCNYNVKTPYIVDPFVIKFNSKLEILWSLSAQLYVNPTPFYSTLSQPAVVTLTWDGWATTTYDNESTDYWPPGAWPYSSAVSQLQISSFNNNTPGIMGGQIGTIKLQGSSTTYPVIGTQGAALPWATLYSIFKFQTRNQFVTTVINSCNGIDPIPCCFIIQPIKYLPSQIKTVSEYQANSKFPMVNNDEFISAYPSNNPFPANQYPIDINSDDIVALDANGNPFPAYFIVPTQGCGGNGSNTIPDCWNDCTESATVLLNNFLYYECTPPPTVPSSCVQIKLVADNNYIMTQDIENQYYNYPGPQGPFCNFAVSASTKNGLNMQAGENPNVELSHINYCSGKNMHFDIQAFDNTNPGNAITPYWTNTIGGSPTNSISLPSTGSYLGGNMNGTMVRYMIVPGNTFGSFVAGEVMTQPSSTPPPPSCGGGSGSSRCGTSYNDPLNCNNCPCGSDSDCTTAKNSAGVSTPSCAGFTAGCGGGKGTGCE